ncbi:sugar ABC transporter permease [Terrabacter sp. Root85]|uniref:sugar ABC transporter permease n=1 Tax=unclassified Terrabacter TaxID=2630222 RepID=UPI0006F71D42|nr:MULTISPECIES: sugar ABC transporter permease [unclassified Terrabacter]KRC92145.1 sugar ABC transporter permease [Terrabacter sp. Root85]KRF48832.1 sugar ABC transporter permease [Terrabacter sp. Soil811]
MATVNAPVPADPRMDTRIAEETGASTPASPKRGGLGGSVWWRHALGILALMWALFPILFIYSAATNPSGTLNTASLWPSGFSTKNFADLFTDSSRPFWTWYKNSMIISLSGALGAVFIGACAAFAFSRLRFKGRRGGMMFLLLTTFFPALLAIVALYIIFAGIGDVLPALGLNTVAGLTLAYLGGALGANVWLLKGYFDTVPRELDEAAIVDGASHVRIFFTMTLRLVMPILVTVFMLVFVGLYGEFMLASVFLTDVDNQTLGVGLYGMTLGNDANTLFGRFTAGALLGSIPVMLLYLAFQRQLVGGLTTGSVK